MTVTRQSPDSLEGSTGVVTEHTLGVCLADGADLAQPVTLGDGGDAIAGLVDTHVARVAEYHIVSVFTLSLCASRGEGEGEGYEKHKFRCEMH